MSCHQGCVRKTVSLSKLLSNEFVQLFDLFYCRKDSEMVFLLFLTFVTIIIVLDLKT